ncbi:type I glyceraldehyde-3-phosphate dehydrogenase [Pajaroellobacter abortibovis]|uniref:Type I glyceraldehyde-3-phosphate dehydrogenase n=1 Tax=Pajaroellobacter abortibovis TaxID=1882918 RepID=A0A1L6MVP3_9BACT|nr:type I glyceraldehyde-3-phosphate dehydrogenase [Pajaroellobacter abortibovis]APR99544.1 type I glyceraldehyde-3-phosphate dehydrogenase [Pajaroellobacter abortibovis]
MKVKIGINGFGRIGRAITRIFYESPPPLIELVAINDLADEKMLAHLYNYDSVHRKAKVQASATKGGIHIQGERIALIAERDPRALPWKSLGVDIVLECTGSFTNREKAAAHLEAGAQKVIISAPAQNPDKTIVLGVNHDEYDPKHHHVISNGSCTTNCLAPIAKIMMEHAGIQQGLMTTVHSYTNDQVVLETPHSKGDLRRARAAAQNMIPTTTGAARALRGVLPALAGKIDGAALRVPTSSVSLVDFTLETERPTSKDKIHAAMQQAAQTTLRGILKYTDEPLVSSDYIGDPHSSIFDATQTLILGDRFVKIASWYDNEWGFSNRMIELAERIASTF